VITSLISNRELPGSNLGWRPDCDENFHNLPNASPANTGMTKDSAFQSNNKLRVSIHVHEEFYLIEI
jgi:hypothetical protein